MEPSAFPQASAARLRPNRKNLASWRWGLCGLLFFATVLSYLDRQTVAICAPAISKEFHLSNEQFGGLLSAFRWTYAVAQLPAGWLADLLPVRITYALALGVWSLAGAAAGWVFSGRSLAGTRGMLGVGEAFNTPCGLRATANALPAQDRALANGLFNSGAAVGALVAPLIIGPIAVHWGWRMAFLTVGAFGMLWVLLWWLHASGPRAQAQLVTRADRRTSWRKVGRDLLAMWKLPRFWLLIVVSGTINPCWYFCADWIPKYMHDRRGFALLSAGLVTIPIFLGADLGNVFGGGLVKFLMSRRAWTLRRARSTACAASALLVIPIAAVGYVRSPVGSIALLTVGAFGLMGIMANYLGCVQEVSFVSVGLVAGVLGAIGNVVGATVNPLIGEYVDATGNYHLIFILEALFPLASLAAMVLFDALKPANDLPPEDQPD